MLLSAHSSRVRQMSDESIRKLEEVCGDKQSLIEHQGGFIYPGTKWCGPGREFVYEVSTSEYKDF